MGFVARCRRPPPLSVNVRKGRATGGFLVCARRRCAVAYYSFFFLQREVLSGGWGASVQ